MKKTGLRRLSILFMLFFSSYVNVNAQNSGEYVINVGADELRFVRRADLGYVVQSQANKAATEELDGMLRGFGAKDIAAVRGIGRRSISVVHSKRPTIENQNAITMLRGERQVKYAAPLFSSNSETVAIIPEIVVRVNAHSDDIELQDLCDTTGLVIKKKLEFTDREYLIEVLAIDAAGVFDALEQLGQATFVEWAVPNIAFRPRLLGQVIADDTYFPDQWHLNNTGQSGGTPDADINAPEAWEISTGDPDIIVAVLDDGVDTDHPDLINNVVSGYDFYDDDSDPSCAGDDAHGTACAGLIAAQGNNGIGVTGVAWNCKIMPIRIIQGGNFVTEADIATAIRWAVNNGADVLSNSWGWPSLTLTIIHSAIKDVTAQGGIGREGRGSVVLASSGNSHGSVWYPAKYVQVIAVGATDHNDNRLSYSCFGTELDIVAPSGKTGLNGDIWTTDIVGSNGYNNRDSNILDYMDKMGGTSASCPIVAGVAALVLSVEPNLKNIDVGDILRDSATDLGTAGFDSNYGYGRIDAHSALDLLPVLPKTRWIARYDGPVNGSDIAYALAVDDSGNVYVTGVSGTAFDYATIKYGPNGNELWVARYNGSGNYFDIAYALAVDDSGNVYVTGQSRDSDTYDDYATIKYDRNGNELWVARYNGPGTGDVGDTAYALAVDDLGNVYVTGVSGTAFDYATIKYDPNGNELWVARYNGPGDFVDTAEALAVDDLGNVYVTGQSRGSGGAESDNDYATIKYSPDGNELWVARYNGTGNNVDMAEALIVDDLGNVYVTGQSTGSGTEYDYATIKYDTNGNELWVARYNGPWNAGDYAYALAVDDLGDVYVTGFSNGSGTAGDYATIKYDSDGNELWVARYNGPGNTSDIADALAVDDFGNVYVTGYSYGSDTRNDYTTIKYSPDGNELWVKRYSNNGTGSAPGNDDMANALAIDDFGNVYVTGKSQGTGTEYDYATIKYSQENYCTAVLDGDLDDNCKVNLADFAILADNRLEESDWPDLVQLYENWLDCNLAYKGACR